MKTSFLAETINIDSNILFIYNKDLANVLAPRLENIQDMISIDCNVLWELNENEKAEKKLALHIEYPYISEVITIYFSELNSDELIKNKNFDTLGILINSNQNKNKVELIIFIPGIKEGLEMISENY